MKTPKSREEIKAAALEASEWAIDRIVSQDPETGNVTVRLRDGTMRTAPTMEEARAILRADISRLFDR